MILRLELPFVDPAVDSVRLESWNVDEKDWVGYGDEICVVLVEERLRLERPSARDLAAGPHGGSRAGDDLMKRGNLDGRFRIVASDQAYMRQRTAVEGEVVRVGALMGILCDDPSKPLGSVETVVEGTIFRAVADPIEPRRE